VNASDTLIESPLFSELTLRGLTFKPALFCAPLAEVTHSAFRRLVADFGGCGAQFTEMLSGKHLLREDLKTSPYVRRNSHEKRLIYQMMLCQGDPVEQIIERLKLLEPDGLDINLACYAPVVRRIAAGSGLFENPQALAETLKIARQSWPGLLTVKIRLGHSTIGMEDRFVERIRIIEESGVDAITLHTRFFEDKFKRRAKHELFKWAASLTRLPIIANGDIAGPETIEKNRELFADVSGLMIGRMAIARPWIFAAWEKPMTIDFAEVWRRFYHYTCEDFPLAKASMRRIDLFTKYYARNFLFGHTFMTAVQNAPTPEAMLEQANHFFATSTDLVAEPSMQGL